MDDSLLGSVWMIKMSVEKSHLNQTWQSGKRKAVWRWHSTKPLFCQTSQLFDLVQRYSGWTFTLFCMCCPNTVHGPQVLQLSESIFQHAEASFSLHPPGVLPTSSFSTTISPQFMASAHTHTSTGALAVRNYHSSLFCLARWSCRFEFRLNNENLHSTKIKNNTQPFWLMSCWTAVRHARYSFY